MTDKRNSEPVLYEQDGNIAFITLNRPEALNAINPALRDGLDDAMERVRNDKTVRVAIVTGAGDRAFCAGADLKWRSQNEDLLQEIDTRGNRPRFVMPGFDLWKPVIASVHGYAIGGGLEIAMSCDVIVASEGSKLGLPEPKRGLAADGGGIHRVLREVPRKLAMEMILTGRIFPASEGLRLGIVNHVVPEADVMSTARSIAEEMIECSPQALRASKQMALLGADKPLADAYSQDFSEFIRLKASGDFVEGPRAFAEKRKPVWEDA